MLSPNQDYVTEILEAGAAARNDPKNPLSLPLADFTRDLNINTTSAFVAAQQAALGFEKLPHSASKTFIFTGNILNTSIIPQLLSMGAGKSATAHIIEAVAAVYKDRGFKYVSPGLISFGMRLTKYRFYYGDERRADGSPVYADISGEAHGEHYLQLAEGKEQGPWQQTFVKGSGYKHF